MKVFGFVAIGLLLACCQGTTQPSVVPPRPDVVPPGPDVLAIIPALDGVVLGSSATLTAVLTAGNGAQRSVTASWSSDAPDIATVQPDGHVDGLRLGRATIRASYEALSTSLSLRVVPDYAGNWSGRYLMADCVRLSGAGPDPTCRFLIGGFYQLRTRLTQDGATLVGTLDIFDNTGRGIVETGAVQGVIDDANALVLSGTTVTTDPSAPSQSTLSDWNTTLTNGGASMVGRFIRDQSFQNFWGPQRVKMTGDPLNLQR